ncbi:hypothetical protein BLA24064_03127 [Burkholderia latens]|uniref:Uncharacterized protein n=1 Tax=Burkholderia latens TaxID=488446 RepID=A0A6P2LAZ1_9BURK|nr:hypothetical protein BLA24064_03127 [Burkholderia latens]
MQHVTRTTNARPDRRRSAMAAAAPAHAARRTETREC